MPKRTNDFTGKETTANPNPSNNFTVTLSACWVKSTAYAYDYTGGEQTFTAPCNGYYKLEVWGASGGDAGSERGGYGAYSTGITNLSKNNLVYINVGEGGESNLEVTRGRTSYNGGGDITWTRAESAYLGAGGGTTHIATVSGSLNSLSGYKDTGGTNISKEILIVSGGGGGASSSRAGYFCRATSNYEYYGGDGGGMESKIGEYEGLNGNISYNANQSTGYAFGLGYERGGGGWYGGYAGGQCAGGGGGSGYIASSNLISTSTITKHMTCYSCTTSSVAATRTNSNTNVSATATADYSKTGNGYAKITYIGPTV